MWIEEADLLFFCLLSTVIQRNVKARDSLKKEHVYSRI